MPVATEIDSAAAGSSRTTLSFEEATRSRRSFRRFLPQPAPDALILQVLEDCQRTPSNCNTQPWHAHVISGETLKRLSAALLEANSAGHLTPDFTFDMDHFYGPYGDRKNAHSRVRYEALGLKREDKAGREAAAAQNYAFFGAPHAVLLFMPSFGDDVRVAADIGMYGQTFLLSLAARGLGGIPQTSLGFFADTAREVLGVSPELKLLFGISFGYPDFAAPGNQTHMDRLPLSESVTFHR